MRTLLLAATLAATATAHAQNTVYANLDSARVRLAQLDGTVRLTGLRKPVTVRRDTWGIPHIYAANQHDLFFAQGYVAAQDRLFQMELWRRQGEGTLSEVLGPRYVQRDRYARLFRYRGNLQREWRSYAPDAREIVTAFVEGVNARIDEVNADSRKLPIEFSILGFAPRRWSPEVPLSRVTPLSGVSNGSDELLRALIVQRLGVATANEFLPTDPHHDIDAVPGLDLAGLEPALLTGAGQTYSDVTIQRLDGSNNWVVAGRRTTSGKPILANDPHRAITNPAVRYIAHLVAPGWNVIGAGEPASPGIAIGHNDRIAFGLTIVGMDQQDVYVESLVPCAAARCTRYKGAARPVTRIMDTIKVRDRDPVVMALEFTPHGPIVSVDTARRRALAIRMVGQEPGTAGYLASLALDRARDWPTYRAAMARWLMPAENMIYADVAGNIGWIAAGLVPTRSWTGLMPVSGDGRYEWGRFLGVNEWPQSFNPGSGYIATANNNILPKGYRFNIGSEFGADWRINRINEVFGQKEKFSITDFEELQHDATSTLARELAPALVTAARRRGADAMAVDAVARWDYRMDAAAVAPLIYESWSQAFARAVYRNALPADFHSLGGRPEWPLVIEAARTGAHLKGMATDTRDSLVLSSLDTALADITRRLGPDRSSWTWGRVHVAHLRHPFASAFDLQPVSRDGDANTVFATGGADMRQTSGASYRQLIDVGDWDRSVAVNVPGQSAQPGSPHYDDLLSYWAEGRYFPLVFSQKAVERETRHTLQLVP